EWCLDRYGDYPTSSVTDPKGARTGLNRVNRGGGWYDYADFCRSASRNSYDPNDNISSYGFRVALSIVQ
ncbi:MAG: SUMF1/EgtB/PvdO family nonheme iron enzyme, partial [Verrucomicrobia bacterium]|nr:SUMF1/EgtB/PvdO family nonheme iron enzyme [Verrucomicrobiota bacterium]